MNQKILERMTDAELLRLARLHGTPGYALYWNAMVLKYTKEIR